MNSDEKKLAAQVKKMEKVLNRAQIENSQMKKEKLKELKKMDVGSEEYNKLSKEIKKIATISDGTKATYADVGRKTLKDAYELFGVRSWKDLKPEHTEEIINRRIDAGQAASTVGKVVHALTYINNHATETRVFKDSHNIDIIDHDESLVLLHERGVIRKAENSHRLKATGQEAEAVLALMEEYNPSYAAIARYEYLTGLRIADSVRQKGDNIQDDRHIAEKSKGGLTNIVHTNHQTEEEKAFINSLLENVDPETGRIFGRFKDSHGNYRSDRSVALSVSGLARRCADKLGIVGENGETFSSHSFRGAFAHNRMLFYVQNHDKLDEIIKQKIEEQPRLKERYEEFEKRIRDKIKPENRDSRVIQDYEKIQWVVSTDLNHSRQEICRYYIPGEVIKEELSKVQK